jgi:hypothetical protein
MENMDRLTQWLSDKSGNPEAVSSPQTFFEHRCDLDLLMNHTGLNFLNYDLDMETWNLGNMPR